MKQYRVLWTVILTTLLVSCSSQMAPIHYYRLTDSQSMPVLPSQHEKVALLLIEPVELAEFLTTGGLVMQTKNHQLQLSNEARWAENLPQAINDNLLINLASQLPDVNVEQLTPIWQQQPHLLLQLQFTDFEVTAQHETVTAGQYWVFNQQHQLITHQRFLIKLALTEDGYEPVVSQLAHSLQQLSHLIAEKLSELTH